MLQLKALSIGVLLLACLAKWVHSAAAKCNTTAFENCVNRMIMFGDPSFVYPTNAKAMNKRCKEVKSLDRCTKDYAQNCLSGETRNSIKVILYGISKSNNAYCTRKTRKTEMIAFGKCLNTHKKRTLAAIEYINYRLHGIQNYPDKKQHIYMACCVYFEGKKRMLDGISRCSESEINNVETIIDSYAADGLNLLCGDYVEESDRCPPLAAKIPKWTGPLKQKVFFLSIVDILNNL